MPSEVILNSKFQEAETRSSIQDIVQQLMVNRAHTATVGGRVSVNYRAALQVVDPWLVPVPVQTQWLWLYDMVKSSLQYYQHRRGVLKWTVGMNTASQCGYHKVHQVTAVAQWLRCCATNQKVAGSIPAGVIGIFHWHKILLIALRPWGRLSL